MTPLNWYYNDNYALDHVGSRTLMIDGDSSISAAEQLENLGYALAPPNSGWEVTSDNVLQRDSALLLPPAAYAIHLGEQIYMYPFGYVVVLALSGSYKLFYMGE